MAISPRLATRTFLNSFTQTRSSSACIRQAIRIAPVLRGRCFPQRFCTGRNSHAVNFAFLLYSAFQNEGNGFLLSTQVFEGLHSICATIFCIVVKFYGRQSFTRFSAPTDREMSFAYSGGQAPGPALRADSKLFSLSYRALVSTASLIIASKASQDMAPRSSPERRRTDTVPLSISRSPTTSI